MPNSTIVVNSANKDLNNPLKDGYLAVKFDIKCVDDPNNTPTNTSDDITLQYGNNNKQKGSTSTIPNTSQWDYEGFLGFSTPGNYLSNSNYLLMQLERGTFRLSDDNLYNEKIKGTVLMYDLDSRAATDFE
ncbi:hypothetical protein D3C76_1417200 [compost metagenome]